MNILLLMDMTAKIRNLFFMIPDFCMVFLRNSLPFCFLIAEVIPFSCVFTQNSYFKNTATVL